MKIPAFVILALALLVGSLSGCSTLEAFTRRRGPTTKSVPAWGPRNLLDLALAHGVGVEGDPKLESIHYFESRSYKEEEVIAGFYTSLIQGRNGRPEFKPAYLVILRFSPSNRPGPPIGFRVLKFERDWTQSRPSAGGEAYHETSSEYLESFPQVKRIWLRGQSENVDGLPIWPRVTLVDKAESVADESAYSRIDSIDAIRYVRTTNLEAKRFFVRSKSDVKRLVRMYLLRSTERGVGQDARRAAWNRRAVYVVEVTGHVWLSQEVRDTRRVMFVLDARTGDPDLAAGKMAVRSHPRLSDLGRVHQVSSRGNR